MATATATYTIHYPDDFDAREEYEMPLKGYFSGVTVELADGRRYNLFFFDPVRLRQELELSAKDARPYVAEPSMVVIPDVTPAAIEQAVAGLVRDRFFDHLKPLDPAAPR
jgi:hypothetical protein